MALGELRGRNLASALMRSRVPNRIRARGAWPVRLAAWVVGIARVPPAKRPGTLSPKDQAAAIQMEKDYLILKRGSASRPSGERNDDDYDVLANGVVVGRILKLTQRQRCRGCGP